MQMHGAALMLRFQRKQSVAYSFFTFFLRQISFAATILVAAIQAHLVHALETLRPHRFILGIPWIPQGCSRKHKIVSFLLVATLKAAYGSSIPQLSSNNK
jgi:hypothetical protein